MSAAPETVSGPLITADGIPLKESLQKSLRRSKIRAALLVAPPLLFLIFLFVIPIGNMLTRSVDDKLINQVLPNTFEAFESWDKVSEPDESMFEAIYQDLKAADKTDIGKASVRMNYAKPGWRSLIKRTARRIKKMEPPYKEAFLKADDRWTDNEYWLSLGIMKDKRTLGYYLNAVDRT
jgi:putative spermidine/putrescine transport system permease protein